MANVNWGKQFYQNLISSFEKLRNNFERSFNTHNENRLFEITRSKIAFIFWYTSLQGKLDNCHSPFDKPFFLTAEGNP
jgi:hypothetical protein